MKIYAIEYLCENGTTYRRFYENKIVRDDIYEFDKKNEKTALVRKRDFEEIKNDD